MCSTNSILVDFVYVIEEFMSFHLVYDLLLLQFVLGASFISPGLEGSVVNIHSFQARLEDTRMLKWNKLAYTFYTFTAVQVQHNRPMKDKKV